MNHLPCRDVTWNTWSKNCLKAFAVLKKQLVSSEVLVHYELDIPLKLVCDASAYPCVSKWSWKTHSLCHQNIWHRLRKAMHCWRRKLFLWSGVKEFHYFLYGSIRIHSGYRTQTSIDNYRYKERITNTCCCTTLENGYHTYCIPICRSTKAYSRLPIARTSHTLIESQQEGFRITEYEIV